MMQDVIYFARDNRNPLVKVGRTRQAKIRMQNLSREHGTRFAVLATVIPNEQWLERDWKLVKLERFAHQMLEKWNVCGEWFLLTNPMIQEAARQLRLKTESLKESL